MIVRLARPEDAGALARIGMAAFQGHPSRPDPAHVDILIRDVLEAGIALLALRGERGIVGSCALVRRKWPHSGEPYLVDAWTFATAPGALRALLGRARAIAERAGLPLYLGVSGARPAAAGRLYQRLGGEPAGGLYRFTGG